MAIDFGPVLDRVTKQLRAKLEADMEREIENRALQIRVRRLEGLLRSMSKRIAKVLAEPSLLEQVQLPPEPAPEPRKHVEKPRRSNARPAKKAKAKRVLTPAQRVAIAKAQKLRWTQWRKDHGVPDDMTTAEWRRIQATLVKPQATA